MVCLVTGVGCLGAFEEQRQGYASAISVILFFVLIALTSLLLIRRNTAERQAA